MSTPVLRQDGLAVVDGVLAEPGLRRLRRYVSTVDYRGVHSQKWDRVWRLWDGAPQRGQSVYFDPDRVFGWKGATYPTSTAVDGLIDEVRQMAASHPDICGVEGIDWLGLYLCPWLYPPGSALSLHQDAVTYSGSFTFFVHSRWSVHWGGELLVYPAASAWPAAPRDAPGLSADEPWMSDDADGDVDGSGIATAISPRPNRLVLIGDARPHRIARVDALAGGHVRASISGFFLRAPH
jgi:hypothetical protein